MSVIIRYYSFNISESKDNKKVPTSPQRQRIARFAAVVEEGRKHNAAQKACREGAAEKAVPQRQRIARFAAVVEEGRKDG